MKTFKNNCTSGLYVKCLDRIVGVKEEFSTDNNPEISYLLNNSKVIIVDNPTTIKVDIKPKENKRRNRTIKETEEPKIDSEDKSDDDENNKEDE